MKTCRGPCGQTKEFIEFNKAKREKNGHQFWCRDCQKNRGSEYRKDPLVKREKAKYSKDYANSPKGKAKKIITDRRYEQSTKGKAAKAKLDKKYLQSLQGSNVRKRATKKYKQTTEGKANTNHLSTKRRAQKLNATPHWLTEEHWQQIQTIYNEASKITAKTGIPHHVDHIMPLQGAISSGLHVPWNLQILPAFGPNGNCSKGNRIK